MNRYLRNSRTINGRLHDELVMMDPEQGKYFSLNSVATRIWDILDSPVTEEEICKILQGEYEIDEQTCHADVKACLAEMARLGLAEIKQ